MSLSHLARHRTLTLLALVALAAACFVDATATRGGERPSGGQQVIKVGSKHFTEQKILGYMVAELIEARTDLEADRGAIGLSGTKMAFQAVQSGEIDLYPEYTGTGWVNILDEEYEPGMTPDDILQQVRQTFREKWNLTWLDPLGFENSYAFAMREAHAEKLGITKVSDLEGHLDDLQPGFDHEFVDRPEFKRIPDVYGFEFKEREIRLLQPSLMYPAIQAEEVDLIDAFTTDGRVDAYNLRLLEDDKGLFPPYDACLLVRQEVLDEHPELRDALGQLSGRFTMEDMRRLNFEVADTEASPECVAHNFLVEEGLLPDGQKRDCGGGLPEWVPGFAAAWINFGIWGQLLRHIKLVAAAMAMAIVVGVGAGLALTRFRTLAPPMLGLASIIQTVPSLALLALMIPIWGIGQPASIAALFLYAVLPILRNTYTAVDEVDPAVIEVGKGMGMTDFQILWKVEIPLCLPVVMAGIRTSMVICVGIATLCTFAAAGGLGDIIWMGMQKGQRGTSYILAGVVPAVVLALSLDGLIALLQYLLTPKGLKLSQ